MRIPLQAINDELNAIRKQNDLFSIWGEFGVGKTIFSIQIALENANVHDQVYYIYSKPNLPFENLENMIQYRNFIHYDNLTFIYLSNFKELYSFISKLESALLNDLKRNRETPKLLIFDSITDLYRLVLNKEKKGFNVKLNYKLNFILATIYYLKTRYNLNTIIVNESSKKMQNDVYHEIQSGGKVMDYWVACSFYIQRTDSLNKRRISLIKDGEVKVDFFLSLTNNGFKL